MGTAPRLVTHDVPTVEEDGAFIGRQFALDLRDKARLAGAVRPDERMRLAHADIEIDMIGRKQSAEALDETCDFEKWCVSHRAVRE